MLLQMSMFVCVCVWVLQPRYESPIHDLCRNRGHTGHGTDPRSIDLLHWGKQQSLFNRGSVCFFLCSVPPPPPGSEESDCWRPPGDSELVRICSLWWSWSHEAPSRQKVSTPWKTSVKRLSDVTVEYRSIRRGNFIYRNYMKKQAVEATSDNLVVF